MPDEQCDDYFNIQASLYSATSGLTLSFVFIIIEYEHCSAYTFRFYTAIHLIQLNVFSYLAQTTDFNNKSHTNAYLMPAHNFVLLKDIIFLIRTNVIYTIIVT